MNAIKFTGLKKKFYGFFEVNLLSYWYIGGFDVCKFDVEFLIPRYKYEDGNTSMKQCIKKEFGDDAVAFIEELNKVNVF